MAVMMLELKDCRSTQKVYKWVDICIYFIDLNTIQNTISKL